MAPILRRAGSVATGGKHREFGFGLDQRIRALVVADWARTAGAG
jgi:hypothetical protein